MSEERDKVISLMKACVVSYKGDVTVTSLANDYMTLNGSVIPFKELGYNTLAQFIESVPEMHTTTGRYGEQIIAWESSSSTDHIARMVAAQKPSKKNTKYATEKFYNNPWKKPFKPPTEGSSSGYTKPENSKYLGKNYDPNYRWKPPAGTYVSNGYRSWDKNEGGQGLDRKATVPRTDNGEKYERYKGPNPTGPRFNTSRQTSSRSETEEDEWETRRTRDSNSSPVHYAEAVADQESWSDGEVCRAPVKEDSGSAPSPATVEAEPPPPKHEPPPPNHEPPPPNHVPSLPKRKPPPKNESPPPKPATMMGLTPAQLMQQARRAADLASSDGHLRGPKLAALMSYAEMVNMAAPLVNVTEHPAYAGHACHILVWLFVFESNKPDQSMLACVEDASEVALNAMNALSLPIESVYDEPTFMINRVVKLVYQHGAGIWKTGIPELYEKAYAEPLPDDWAENGMDRAKGVAITVLSSPNIKNEIWKAKLVLSMKVPPAGGSYACYTPEGTSGFVRPDSMRPIANEPIVMQPHAGVVRPIFRPPDYVPVFRSGPTNVQPPGPMPARFNPRARLNPPLTPSPTQLSGTPSPIDSLEPASLTPVPDFAESGTTTPPNTTNVVGECVVLVMRVKSTADVWVRKFDRECNAAYNSLCTDMNQFYSSDAKTVALPVVGKHFAVQTGSGWSRAKLTSIGLGNCASLTFIDLGTQSKINFGLCYNLEARFCSVPPQAIHCALEGMEELCEFTEHLPLLVETLVGKPFQAEVKIRAEESTQRVFLSLFNLVNNDVNINFWLTESMSEGVTMPTLPPVGHTVEAYLAHISEDGEVFVHVVGEAFKFLKVLLRQLASRRLDMTPYRVNNVIVNRRRYLVLMPDTNAFVRVVVLTEPDPDGRIVVGYLDYGNIEYSHINYIYDLGDLAAALGALPPLAMPVVLHNLPPVTQQMTQLLLGLAPLTQAVILKVVKVGLTTEVELFKRIQPNNMLVSINNTMENDPRIQAMCNAQAMLESQQEVVSAFAPVPRLRSAPAIPDTGSEASHASTSPDAAQAAAALPISLTELKEMINQLSTSSGVPNLSVPTTTPAPAFQPGFASPGLGFPAADVAGIPPAPMGSFPTSPMTGFPTGPMTGFPTDTMAGVPPWPAAMGGLPTPEQYAYYLHQLPPPVLPPPGVEFDVRVPLVSNPSNFYVQPWVQNVELEQMMRNMQTFYGGPRFHQPVNPEDVHPGTAYSTLHEDNFWYRVTARNVACNMQVLVSFSDFGDLRVVPLSSLRVLDDAFMKLPKQSIKARLYGIKPTYHDWSVDDCIYFQRLVNAKPFVSFIHEQTPDPEYPNELIVGLTLVDTSSDGQDVHIDKLLVRERRAVVADVANKM